MAESSWSELKDDEGRVFYHNELTAQSQWTKPRELMSLEELASAEKVGVWKEFEDNGIPFWYNAETNESVWTKPEELVVENVQPTVVSNGTESVQEKGEQAENVKKTDSQHATKHEAERTKQWKDAQKKQAGLDSTEMEAPKEKKPAKTSEKEAQNKLKKRTAIERTHEENEDQIAETIERHKPSNLKQGIVNEDQEMLENASNDQTESIIEPSNKKGKLKTKIFRGNDAGSVKGKKRTCEGNEAPTEKKAALETEQSSKTPKLAPQETPRLVRRNQRRSASPLGHKRGDYFKILDLSSQSFPIDITTSMKVTPRLTPKTKAAHKTPPQAALDPAPSNQEILEANHESPKTNSQDTPKTKQKKTFSPKSPPKGSADKLPTPSSGESQGSRRSLRGTAPPLGHGRGDYFTAPPAPPKKTAH